MKSMSLRSPVRVALLALAAAPALAAAAAPAQVAPPAGGESMQSVAAGRTTDQAIALQANATSVSTAGSTFTYRVGGTWIETANGQTVATWTEQNRQAGSQAIYLNGPNRRSLMFDFFHSTIQYTSPEQKLPITSTGSGVTIANVTEVDFASGKFKRNVLTRTKAWTEFDPSGHSHFTFTETQRDCCNVYLYDASRGVQLGINLNSMGIYYSDATVSQPFKIYDVTKAKSVQFFTRAVIN